MAEVHKKKTWDKFLAKLWFRARKIAYKISDADDFENPHDD